MTLHPKTLFLADGLGALLSAFLLGIVLVKFESVFGMPSNVLYFLSALALIMGIFSMSNHFLNRPTWQLPLKIIAFVNLQYCCLTGILVFYFHKELTTSGILYFAGEMCIIMTLAVIELYAAYKKTMTFS